MVELVAGLWGTVFFASVLCFVLGELVLPRRRQKVAHDRRWSTNLGLFLINSGLQRLLVPLSALAVAQAAAESGSGLLNWLQAPAALAVVAGVLLLDLWKYLEHRLMHAVPLFWRLHRVHHVDTVVDVTTAERHHPLESLVGIVGMAAVCHVFGIPPLAVASYVLAATVVALFSHANLRVPGRLERALGWLVVTPEVHGVHHSAERRETDSNFALTFTLWDRLFGTFRQDAAEAAAQRRLGLEYFRDDRSGWLDRVLLMPLAPMLPAPLPQDAGDGRLGLGQSPQ